MTKESRFRVWDMFWKKMDYNPSCLTVFGDYKVNANFITHYEDNPDKIWLEYIGVVDSNKKRMYVGDIVEATKEYDFDFVNGGYTKSHKIRGVVEFSNKRLGTLSGFFINPTKNYFRDEGWYDYEGWLEVKTEDMTVIGNTYENPELLEE